MNNLVLRDLRCDDELGRNAVHLSSLEWIKTYNVHPHFQPGLTHFSVAADGSHPFAPSETLAPRFLQAAARLFILGVQVASEEKGDGGATPTTSIGVDSPHPILGPDGLPFASQCATSIETGHMIYTRTHVERLFANDGFNRDVGHTKRIMNPFQAQLAAGIEEGLHARSYQSPENRKRFIAGVHSDYSRDEGERFIHDDLVSIIDKLNPVYDRETWLSFVAAHNKHDAIRPSGKAAVLPVTKTL